MALHRFVYSAQAGVRSFIITFDVYVILDVLRNMIIKDLTPYVRKPTLNIFWDLNQRAMKIRALQVPKGSDSI